MFQLDQNLQIQSNPCKVLLSSSEAQLVGDCLEQIGTMGRAQTWGFHWKIHGYVIRI